jgi:drug/metabolite transporter (DMT)-like permease
MVYLLITSLLWAFSFTLVKTRLSGLDQSAVAVIRLGISTLLFLPLLRPRGLGASRCLRLAGIGALQFGLMYLLFHESYEFLKAYEIVLFTVMTPIYVMLLDAVLEWRWTWRFALASAAAVVGTLLVAIPSARIHADWRGILLVQGSNLCFAGGQLLWRREMRQMEGSHSAHSLFALPYLGAFATTAAISFITNPWPAFTPSATQWLTLLYLGTIASGLCFFLWNLGASKVNAGVLASMNNAKMPLGIAVALLLGGEQADLPRLFAGGGLVAFAAWWCSKPTKTPSA